jgi:hypothetical protein
MKMLSNLPIAVIIPLLLIGCLVADGSDNVAAKVDNSGQFAGAAMSGLSASR